MSRPVAPPKLEAIIATAAEAVAGVRSVYVLPARGKDAYEFAIVLEPFEQRTLVEVHYAIVNATDSRAHAGRVLYVDGGLSSLPVPIANARAVSLLASERAAAKAHIETHGRKHDRVAIETWFREHAAQVFEPAADPFQIAVPGARAPYRSVAVNLRTRVLEVVSDPFPTGPRARILVIDEDGDTADILRRSQDFEVTHIDEGWAAVEAVERTGYDAILCALRVGAMSGASLHRLIVKTRPALASRIAFVAAPHVVTSAPPSSALGRVLARPVSVEQVRALVSISR